MDDGRAEGAVHDIGERAAIEGEGARHAPAVSPLIEGTAETAELANAEHMVALHGARMRFAVGLGWLVWDGRRFAHDEGAAAELAKDTLRQLFLEASETAVSAAKRAVQLKASGDAQGREEAQCQKEGAEARANHAKRSQSARGVDAMLRLAESDPRVRVSIDGLDRDPYLLNVANGTIDLRTGELRDHDPGDLITKVSPVAYDPVAPLDDWLGFLHTATGDDESTIAYLQRCAGYSLTGETSQERFFFLHGPSGSAKSTFVDAVRGVLGDYAAVTSFDTFTQRRHVEAQRPDLARLAGARMVSAAEVSADRRLDEGVISNATGGDRVNACHKYRDPFDFKPRFKLWLLANKRPHVNDMEDETGIWRRMACLPFDVKIPKDKIDPDIKARFTDPKRGGPVVLRWAVEGAVLYVREGRLVEPARVEQAAESYRAENDPIRDFVTSRLVLASTPASRDVWILKARLRQLYDAYAKDEGVRPLDAKGITKRLRAKPYSCVEGSKRHGTKVERAWFGVRERSAADDAADETGGAGEPDPDPDSPPLP